MPIIPTQSAIYALLVTVNVDSSECKLCCCTFQLSNNYCVFHHTIRCCYALISHAHYSDPVSSSLEPGSFNLCVGGKKSLVHTVCACSKSRRNSDAIGNYRSRLHYVTRIITSSQREASRASYECFTTSVDLRFGYQTLL